MKNSQSKSYAEAGVDITAGYKAVELMKSHIARTLTSGVCSDVGGFGGLFELDTNGMERPTLVSGTDGVGTKLKLAFLMDKHDTVGIDCVAMCVNDIICCGAKPLFFLDYIACGKNVPERVAQIVAGVAEGCVQSGAALIGGETAEMPGFYPADEYDLAGFSVGIVDKTKIPDNKSMCEGDAVIALPSSGVHSNGFSLVRKVKGVSHITGGGFYENIPRSIPDGLGAEIKKADVRTLPIFDLIAKAGDIPERDMYNTFNMGVGMSAVVAAEDAEKAVETLKANGVDAYILGKIIKSTDKVVLI